MIHGPRDSRAVSSQDDAKRYPVEAAPFPLGQAVAVHHPDDDMLRAGVVTRVHGRDREGRMRVAVSPLHTLGKAGMNLQELQDIPIETPGGSTTAPIFAVLVRGPEPTVPALPRPKAVDPIGLPTELPQGQRALPSLAPTVRPLGKKKPGPKPRATIQIEQTVAHESDA